MTRSSAKILIVVQRYGSDVVGGSEALARAWAQRLAKTYEVTVATTCAQDDASWTNIYPPGESKDGRVFLKRFLVDKVRDLDAFSRYSSGILGRPQVQPTLIQEKWMLEQGPISSPLFDFLKNKSGDYHLIIFITYLYATTALGLRLVSSSPPVILVPTAHDEPPIHLSIFREVFRRPDFLLFCTEAERRFCLGFFPEIQEKSSSVVGCGVEVLEEKEMPLRADLPPYLAYAGRIAHGKGMAKLFEYYQGLPKALRVPIHLMGKVQMDCPKDDGLQYLGFVPEAERTTQIRNARAMIVPSPFESLSLSTLESWALKTPVIVNGWCEVLVDHVRKSQGGLIYRDSAEFRNCMEYALTHPEIMIQLGEQGNEYTKKYYSWSVIEEKLDRSISAVLSSKDFSEKRELEV